MTGKELLNTDVTFYKNIGYKLGYNMKLIEFLQNEVRYQKQIELARSYYGVNDKFYKKMKQELPCATLSCTCNHDKSDIDKVNNILVIDIDHVDNPEEIKRKVIELPYIFLTHLSVSGKGLFALAYIEDPSHYGEHYNSIYEDFKKLGIKIDKQCSNLNRLRFLSWDTNMLIKTGEVQQYTKKLQNKNNIKVKIEQPIINDNNYKRFNDDGFVAKALYLLIYENKYKIENCNYNEWLIHGFRLASLGYKLGIQFWLQLCRQSDGYVSDEDAIAKFENCLNTTKFDRSCIVFYFSKLKEIYGSSWIERVNEVL